MLSFHNFFETLNFHYHLLFDVFWHTGLFSGNTLHNISTEHPQYLTHLSYSVTLLDVIVRFFMFWKEHSKNKPHFFILLLYYMHRFIL